MDERNPRDGRILEKLGHMDPLEKDDSKQLVLDVEKTKAWLEKGAIPSDAVIDILRKVGLTCSYMEKKEKRRAKARTIARKKGKLYNEADRIAAKKKADAEAAAAEAAAKAAEEAAKAKAAEEAAKAKAAEASSGESDAG